VRLEGTARFDCAVNGIKRDAWGWILETTQGRVQTKYFINCAGLQADRVTRLSKIQPKVSIIPFKGKYFLVKPERRQLVKNLIYPVPNPALPFLGVHFTRTLDGCLEAGPNAILSLDREGYEDGQVNLRDTCELLFDARWWKMALRYWKMGFTEMYRNMSKKSFVEELKNLVPSVDEDDLTDGPSGVRAQCVDDNGVLVNDFKIVEAPQAIHVLNVPSPAATASLAIGNYIARLATNAFGLRL
ncbi:MAG: FAD-dependent oxidoreductase, partial [Candidatus Omnitrophica bacterium]|nr:FAD-dependent oxidoreductase [Candidatus Omnitrophota bacterium]